MIWCLNRFFHPLEILLSGFLFFSVIYSAPTRRWKNNRVEGPVIVKIPIFLQICLLYNLEDYTIRIQLSRFYVDTV